MTETLTRILLEVCNGKLSARKDTPEEAEYRRRTEIEVAEIRAKGEIVDIPADWPDLSDEERKGEAR